MNSKLKQLRSSLDKLQGEKAVIEKDLDAARTSRIEAVRDLRRHERAREIVKLVAQKTQEKLQYHISNITTMALETVFDNAYELGVEFVERRNRTECDLFFERNGLRVDPITESGGGTIDVAAFALRVASWSMQVPKNRPVLILDEPFKHLKGRTENIQVLDMIQEISSKLGLQIITVSDERIDRADITSRANKVFEGNIKKGITKITVL